MSDRIALVSTSYPEEAGDPSGHFVAAEAATLARAGHRVLVVTTLGTTSRSRIADNGIEVLRLPAGESAGWPGVMPRLRQRPLRALSLLRWIERARRALRQRAPFDRTIAHFLFPAGFPLVASLPSNGVVEVVVHGSDARLCARLPRPLRRGVGAALQRRNAHFRCSSHDVARTLELALGLPAGSSSIATPLLDLDGVPDRARCRQLLGLDPARRVAVVVGRLVPGKRVDEALAATRLIEGLETIVVGDGPELERLERDFPEATFVGRVPRPRALAWIAAADVLVSASRDEGAPSVIREARALGVAVVARPAGDVARWAETDRGLIVVP